MAAFAGTALGGQFLGASPSGQSRSGHGTADQDAGHRQHRDRGGSAARRDQEETHVP